MLLADVPCRVGCYDIILECFDSMLHLMNPRRPTMHLSLLFKMRRNFVSQVVMKQGYVSLRGYKKGRGDWVVLGNSMPIHPRVKHQRQLKDKGWVLGRAFMSVAIFSAFDRHDTNYIFKFDSSKTPKYKPEADLCALYSSEFSTARKTRRTIPF